MYIVYLTSKPVALHLYDTRGLILGRGIVPVPSSFPAKSFGFGVRELKIQSLGFGVRELKKVVGMLNYTRH